MIYLSIEYGPGKIPVPQSTIEIFFPGFIPETWYSCIAMLVVALVCFLLAVYIDFKKSKLYRKQDGKRSLDN